MNNLEFTAKKMEMGLTPTNLKKINEYDSNNDLDLTISLSRTGPNTYEVIVYECLRYDLEHDNQRFDTLCQAELYYHSLRHIIKSGKFVAKEQYRG